MTTRLVYRTAALAIVLAGAAAAAPAQSTSFVVARTGIRTDAPQVGTYHYLEFFQTRGDWVIPDFGALDFSHDSYRELFVGAGRTLYNGKRVTWVEELYFAQAVGSVARKRALPLAVDGPGVAEQALRHDHAQY